MDPRETPSNGRVAHVSLKGRVDAERFVEGEVRVLLDPSAALRGAPSGPRLRELVLGEAFRVIDTAGADAFGLSEKDGYVGWLPLNALASAAPPTDHWVTVARSYLLGAPDLKSPGVPVPVYFASRVAVLGVEGDWAEIHDTGCLAPNRRYIPRRHIAPLSVRFTDPAAVAGLFLHTPYLWGGNTGLGIDCSGLVQAALLACAIPCPGDSDQQEARVGTALPPDAPLERSDLIFWRGHVAIALDAETVIHANAHHMAVATEPLKTARARIEASGGGEITSRRRP